MAVVSNSTPLIWLAKLGKLELLRKLYGKVFISPIVKEEIVEAGKKVGAIDAAIIEKQLDIWVKVKEVPKKYLPNVQMVKEAGELHAGEAETIALAKEYSMKALIDERIASRTAQVLGVATIGTLGVLIEALEKNLLSYKQACELINELATTKFRLSAKERDRALEAARIVEEQRKKR